MTEAPRRRGTGGPKADRAGSGAGFSAPPVSGEAFGLRQPRTSPSEVESASASPARSVQELAPTVHDQGTGGVVNESQKRLDTKRHRTVDRPRPDARAARGRPRHPDHLAAISNEHALALRVPVSLGARAYRLKRATLAASTADLGEASSPSGRRARSSNLTSRTRVAVDRPGRAGRSRGAQGSGASAAGSANATNESPDFVPSLPRRPPR